MKRPPDHRPDFDWAGLAWLYLFFFYFAGTTPLLLMLSNVQGFVGVRQAMIMSLLWLVPVLLIPSRARLLAGAIGLVLWFFSLFSLGYFMIYGQEFSQSVIFITFESNPAEASEYAAQYASWSMLGALLAYSLPAWLLWRRIRPVHLPRQQVVLCGTAICSGLFLYPPAKQMTVKGASFETAIEDLKQRMQPVVPWQMAIGYLNYRTILGNMNTLLDSNAQVPPLSGLVDQNGDRPATLVLLIGESTNRHHMSLYGYPRPTSPRLEGLRNELAVFDQVIGPRPYTIEALQQILTFANQEAPDLYLSQPSIMNLMQQAGYHSIWITNQQTMTERNTMLTTFARQTDEQVFLNHRQSQDASHFDDSVLLPFEKALAHPAPKKFIVVHLLGAHMKYRYRYPESHNRFRDREGAPDWLTDSQLTAYNQYDNAVLFNDEVVANLIDRLRARDERSLMVYFSDHGEDVFDSPGHDFNGRNEAAPTEPMYAVPFLIWRSARWRTEDRRDFRGMLDRPYSTSDFIHTWADLTGLRFDKLDTTRSLVSTDFVERPLWVGDPYAAKPLHDLRKFVDQRPPARSR